MLLYRTRDELRASGLALVTAVRSQNTREELIEAGRIFRKVGSGLCKWDVDGEKLSRGRAAAVPRRNWLTTTASKPWT